VTPAVGVANFSASNLVDEFVVSIIILGLGTSESTKMFKHAIMHGTRAIADAFKELRNADQQSKLDKLAGGSGTALATRAPSKEKKREWQPYYCKEHGPNKSHNSKECKKLNGKTTTNAKVAAETPEETAYVANIPEVAYEQVVFKGKIKGKVAMLDGQTLDAEDQAFATIVSKELLHERLGHIGEGRLDTMINKDLTEGILVDKKSKAKDTCKYCIAGKQHRNPFPKLATNRSKVIIECIHTDVHGPLPKTLSGYRYWIVFVDDAGWMKGAKPLKAKGEASDEIQKYIARVENQTGNKVKIIRDDKGGEYMSNDLKEFLDKKGIIHEQTNRATPLQNGVAERLNCTLAEGIVAMLSQANLLQSFWAQALLYLIEILNVTPSSSISDTSSYEYWYKRKPDLSKFRVFGCRIGTRVGVTGDAIFDEKTFPGLSQGESSREPLGIKSFWFEDSNDDEEQDKTVETQHPNPTPTPSNQSMQPTTQQQQPEVTTNIQATQLQQPTPPPSLPPPSTSAPMTVSFPTTSLPASPSKPATPVRKRTYAESATPPLPQPPTTAIPPTSQRPIQKVTEKVTDYYDGVGT
ncbi:hypothetical protein FS837_005384, partial [Tulasnella sp. UAMH 9824]